MAMYRQKWKSNVDVHNVQIIFPQCANAKKQGFDNVQIIFHNVQCPKKAVSAMCKLHIVKLFTFICGTDIIDLETNESDQNDIW